MPKKNSVIIDLQHDFSSSMPRSKKIFYQCLKCWCIVPSDPTDSLSCSCGNISIDTDAGRAGCRDQKTMRVLEIQSES
jgi:hypothetical protein